MTSYTLIDGNNYLRRLYEKDRDISGLRASVLDVRSEIARPNNQVVFFWDGFNANDWRKAIYPNYKSNRSNSQIDQNDFFEQINIFRKIVENLSIPYFRVDGYEADDLIAAFALALPTGTKIHIKSTDKDFEQIVGATHEGRTIEDTLKDEIEKERVKGKSVEGLDWVITSDLVVPFKTMVGDTSDSIKGIPGFGKKRWLLSDKQPIKDWFARDFAGPFPEMSDTLANWCANNLDELRAMRDACLFRPIDKDFLASNMKRGVDNPAAVEQILKDNLA